MKEHKDPKRRQEGDWPSSPSQEFLYRKLLQSYRLCLKNKPELKQTSWHWQYESELHKLSWMLFHNRYRPEKSSIFVVSHPKNREVIASGIGDRVVHRMVYEYMSPYWERRFLPGSYACRAGKGPLKAVQDLEAFLRAYERHSSHHSPQLFALKADISRFFPSLRHDVLEKMLDGHLQNSFMRRLVSQIIRHRATAPGAYVLKSPRAKWKLIEREKSLFCVPLGQGLPIGNLTSQFFANVYLHPLDVWLATACKQIRDDRGLRVFLLWQRYVDDLLVIGTDSGLLARLLARVSAFVEEELQLHLNPRKTSIRAVCQGIDHLGYYVKPGLTVVRRSVRHRTIRRLGESGLGVPLLAARLQSALGHSAHGRNRHLCQAYVHRVRSRADGHGIQIGSCRGTFSVRVGPKEPAGVWLDSVWSSALFAPGLEFDGHFVKGARQDPGRLSEKAGRP